MDTADEYEFVITFLSSVEFSLFICQISWYAMFYCVWNTGMNQQWLVTMLCNVHCIEPFEMQVNAFDLLVLQKSYSVFCWQCLLEDFFSPKPVHHHPSHWWVNHSKTYHPYPERVYNFNLQEVAAAFYPLFSRLKYRHSSSFSDLCAFTDALCGQEVIRSSVCVLVPSASPDISSAWCSFKMQAPYSL